MAWCTVKWKYDGACSLCHHPDFHFLRHCSRHIVQLNSSSSMRHTGSISMIFCRVPFVVRRYLSAAVRVGFRAPGAIFNKAMTTALDCMYIYIYISFIIVYYIGYRNIIDPIKQVRDRAFIARTPKADPTPFRSISAFT